MHDINKRKSKKSSLLKHSRSMNLFVKKLKGRAVPFKQYRLVNLINENIFIKNLQNEVKRATDLTKSKIKKDEKIQKLREAILKIIKNNKSSYTLRPKIRDIQVVLNEGSSGAIQLGSLAALPGLRGPRVYTYGGISSKIRASLLAISTYNGKYSEQYPWKEGKIPLGRFGHIMHRFDSKRLLIFGGEIGTSRKDFTMSQFKLYRILGLFLFNVESNQVQRLVDDRSHGPRPRKFFASCLVDKNYLLVFGGIESAQMVSKTEQRPGGIGDLWLFDFCKKSWYKLAFSTHSRNFYSKGIMFHQMASAYKYSIKQLDCLKGRELTR